jgi:hypothetical protein
MLVEVEQAWRARHYERNSQASRLVSGQWHWLMYNPCQPSGSAFMPLSNAEKQARYIERRLGVNGEKARVGLILNAATRAQMGRLARRRGYTLTALIEKLVASAERRVTTRLSGKALKRYLDGK